MCQLQACCNSEILFYIMTYSIILQGTYEHGFLGPMKPFTAVGELLFESGYECSCTPITNFYINLYVLRTFSIYYLGEANAT